MNPHSTLKYVTITLALSLLSACGGGGTPAPTTPTPAAANTGVVTYFTALTTALPITFQFDGSAVVSGTLSSAMPKVGTVTTAPVCGSNSASAFSKTLTVGVHNKNVVSVPLNLVWTPTVNVTPGCTLIELI